MEDSAKKHERSSLKKKHVPVGIKTQNFALRQMRWVVDLFWVYYRQAKLRFAKTCENTNKKQLYQVK